MSNQWLRLWHDMPTDPKWRTISRASKQRIGDVMGVYLHLLVSASASSSRGRAVAFNAEDVASALDIDIECVDAIVLAMQGRVLDDDLLLGWEKRQVAREDGGAARAKAWREGKKAQPERIRTQPNATERDANANERIRTHAERNRTPDTDTDTDTEEAKELTPSGVVIRQADDSTAKPEIEATPKQSAIRLAAVTRDAVETFNAAMSVQGGGVLSAVTLPDSDKRRAQVRRSIKVIRQICERLFQQPEITREFWGQYWGECAADAFKSGRGPYGNGHDNWRPDFEYLTRPDVIEKTLDDALSRQS